MTFHEEEGWVDDYAADREREARWDREAERERAEEIERDRLTRDVPTPKVYRGGTAR